MAYRKPITGLAAVLVIISVLLISTSSFAAEPQKVNINSANKVQLMTLSGVGEKVATSIIIFREKNGPFKTSEEIMKVKGFGPKTMAKNKDRIFVSPTKISMQRK